MKEFFTKVVGVAYDNDDGSSRQAYIKPLRAGDRLCLEHHPHHPYEANAIAVLAPYRRWFKIRWRQIGHLNAELAERSYWTSIRGSAYRRVSKRSRAGREESRLSA